MESSATPPGDGLPVPRRYASLAAILLGIAMAVLDETIVNLALPAIVRDLHAEAAAAVWVITAYQVSTLVLLLPCALLGELVGHRRVYLGGLVLFTLGSLASALAPSLAALVAARVAQGLGAAGLMSVNSALVRLTYPAHQLGRGIAINSVVVATASVAGPTLAAAVLSVASWPWLFAVNLPLGVVIFAIGRKALPETVARPPAGTRLSAVDVLLNVLTFGLVFLGADALGSSGSGHDSSLGPAFGAVLLATGLAAGVLYLRRQRHERVPLFPLDLLRIPVFALSMGTSIAAFAAQTLAYVALPFLLLEGLGRSPAAAGLLITAWPAATVVAAPFAGRLIGRVADGLLGAAGLALMAVGLTLLALLPAEAANADIVWRLALCGFGFGLFQSPNNHTILTVAPVQRSGAAGGMLGSARLTGRSTGALVIGIAFGVFGANSTRGPLFALGVGAVFAAVAAALSAVRLRSGPDRPAGQGDVAAAGGRAPLG